MIAFNLGKFINNLHFETTPVLSRMNVFSKSVSTLTTILRKERKKKQWHELFEIVARDSGRKRKRRQWKTLLVCWSEYIKNVQL